MYNSVPTYVKCNLDCSDFCEPHTHAKRLNVGILCIELDPHWPLYTSTDKSLARPGRKQATVTEDFEFHISYL